MTILLTAVLIRIGWLLVEVRYLRRYRVIPARDWDRHSATVWDIANGLEPLGLVLGFMGVARIPASPAVAGILGLALLLSGIVIRWTAIYSRVLSHSS